MTYRTTITIENDNYDFLNTVACDNRSAYINALLTQARKETLISKFVKANKEEADMAYQEELQIWDNSLSDGLKND